MTQSFITQFFPRIEDTNGTLTAYVTVNGHEYEIGSLELYEDEDDRNWVNNVEVNDQWQRRGYGRMLVKEASQRYGTIHFSTQAKHEAVEDDDTRHLSEEGAALANSCVRHGLDVLLCHPSTFAEQSEDEYNMDALDSDDSDT